MQCIDRPLKARVVLCKDISPKGLYTTLRKRFITQVYLLLQKTGNSHE